MDQDTPSSSGLLSFKSPHEYQTYNHAIILEAGRNGKHVDKVDWDRDNKPCINLPTDLFLKAGCDVVTTQVDVTELAKAADISQQQQLHGALVTLHPRKAGCNVQFDCVVKHVDQMQCTLLIQDKSPGVATCGSMFSVDTLAPDYVQQAMMESVKQVRRSTEAYAAMAVKGHSLLTGALRPDLYIAILGCDDAPKQICKQSKKKLKEKKVILGDRLSNLKSIAIDHLTGAQEAILNKVFNQSLTLVQGPPGTGKSLVAGAIVRACFDREMMTQLSSKVLMVAPSNVASDNLARIAVSQGLYTVRINSQVRNFSAEPIPEDIASLSLTTSVLDYLKQIPIHEEAAYEAKIGMSLLKAYELLHDGYSGVLNVGSGQHDLFAKLSTVVETTVLDLCDVIVTTCFSSCHRRLTRYTYPVAIVDEATQALEPETLIAAALNPTHLVLLGDQCQLGPTVSRSISMFERLALAGQKCELLDTQFRMHPKLAVFPSQVFYEGRIKSGVSDSDRQHSSVGFPWRGDSPMLFIKVRGKTSSAGFSYKNAKEADWIRNIVRRLLRCQVEASTITVITPYSGQRLLLRQYFSSINVRCCSVDEFQGRENDYIIISCVRSDHRLGFLKDGRRVNVAMTRAKRGLIVVGQPDTLARHSLWNDLLFHFQSQRCVVEGKCLDTLHPITVVQNQEDYRFDFRNSRKDFKK